MQLHTCLYYVCFIFSACFYGNTYCWQDVFLCFSNFLKFKILGFFVFNLYIKYRKLSYKFNKPSKGVKEVTSAVTLTTTNGVETPKKVFKILGLISSQPCIRPCPLTPAISEANSNLPHIAVVNWLTRPQLFYLIWPNVYSSLFSTSISYRTSTKINPSFWKKTGLDTK